MALSDKDRKLLEDMAAGVSVGPYGHFAALARVALSLDDSLRALEATMERAERAAIRAAEGPR